MISNDETFLLVVDESSKQYVSDVRSTIFLERHRKYTFLKFMLHPIVASRNNRELSSLNDAHKQADREFRELAKFAFSKFFHAGDIIFQQGSTCGSVLFVVSGSVDIIVTLQGTQASHVIEEPIRHIHTRQPRSFYAGHPSCELLIVSSNAPHVHPHKFVHNSDFHSKLISDVINHSNDSVQKRFDHQQLILKGLATFDCFSSGEEDMFISDKLINSQRTQHESVFIPRPPLIQKKGLCSPRARSFIEMSRSRMTTKSFRLKSAIGGNTIGNIISDVCINNIHE